MNKQALFNFIVSKDDHTVTIERSFDAPLDAVWDAFTKAEILDRWWAPKPYASRTKRMDFKVGGSRFYAMVDPDGQAAGWQVQQYTSITPKSNFKYFSAFADKDGNLQLPGSNWNLSFREENGGTVVSIIIHNDSLERMERLIEMGFKEGFTQGLDQLDELLGKR
ncbi:MAG: SRPBCC domain-containing protein [Flavobacteriales bacterium]|nr:SRPBCC domain-containing protein [Flavobacteriales bacterium]MEB2342875.1 SRPBCC domain-containing protein [Flavobacteriia bacterium]